MLNSDRLQIVVNGVTYNLHKNLLEKMDIFRLLADCETDIMPPIDWDISQENVIKAFQIAAGEICEIPDSLSEHIEIIKFLQYLSAGSDVICKCVRYMIGESIISYLDKCKEIPYDETMLFIFDTHPCWRLTNNLSKIDEKFRILIDKIIGSPFPIDFQKKVIMRFSGPLRPTPQKGFNFIPETVKNLDFSWLRQQY